MDVLLVLCDRPRVSNRRLAGLFRFDSIVRPAHGNGRRLHTHTHVLCMHTCKLLSHEVETVSGNGALLDCILFVKFGPFISRIYHVPLVSLYMYV
jgi:hypothetical protein